MFGSKPKDKYYITRKHLCISIGYCYTSQVTLLHISSEERILDIK